MDDLGSHTSADHVLGPVDTVVVGAGQAGLAVSHLLRRAGHTHVVFERGRVGESWRSQRWDTFTLNTPNWANALPGAGFATDRPDAFAARDEVVAFLEDYATSSSAPVVEGVTVLSVEATKDGRFDVVTTAGTVRPRNVVVCAGGMTRARVPAMAERLPEAVDVLTAATYRNAAALAEGAVLVVGSGQSGCQVAEDLLDAGRTVYVCASDVARVPRRYRGRDIIAWLVDTGFFDVTRDELEAPGMQYAAQPQVSGTHGGHTVSLQSLARDGATLLGRLNDIDGPIVELGPTLPASVAFADEKAALLRARIDEFIAARGIEAPAAEPDPNEPGLDLDVPGPRSLDLGVVGVRTVIWCVGFDADLGFLPAEAVDERGNPRHVAGVSQVPGLVFVGFPWLSRRSSGILLGIEEDARRIVDHVTARG